jgi:hypothetical protein
MKRGDEGSALTNMKATVILSGLGMISLAFAQGTAVHFSGADLQVFQDVQSSALTQPSHQPGARPSMYCSTNFH